MMTVINAVWTVLSLIIFIGIVVWAWSARQQDRFDAAANAPFDDASRDEKHG
ncbi:MAG: cbb3-type cytochrome c oxidase subunit 3 [Gammaproteobacteria bacterium]|nr:cbb3-type cytochrome c oxidase subunit 3 [Gammaproteobacteria bacterium]